MKEISYKVPVFVLIALIGLETSLQTGFTQGLQLIFLFQNDVHDTSKLCIGDGPQRHITGTYLHLQIFQLFFLFCSKRIFFPMKEISYKVPVFVLIALIGLETSLQTGFTQGLQLIFLFQNDVHDTSKLCIGDGPQRHITGTYLHLQIFQFFLLFWSQRIFFATKEISDKRQVFVLIALIGLETSLQTGFTQSSQLIFALMNDVQQTNELRIFFHITQPCLPGFNLFLLARI